MLVLVWVVSFSSSGLKVGASDGGEATSTPAPASVPPGKEERSALSLPFGQRGAEGARPGPGGLASCAHLLSGTRSAASSEPRRKAEPVPSRSLPSQTVPLRAGRAPEQGGEFPEHLCSLAPACLPHWTGIGEPLNLCF